MEYGEKWTDIIRGELVAAFTKLKYHKLLGSDGILYEILTALVDIEEDIFYKICLGKRQNICDNYRTIAFISDISNVMPQILLEGTKL